MQLIQCVINIFYFTFVAGSGTNLRKEIEPTLTTTADTALVDSTTASITTAAVSVPSSRLNGNQFRSLDSPPVTIFDAVIPQLTVPREGNCKFS